MALASDIEIFQETEWSEIADCLSLSQRQSQIIRLLLSGRSDKQIAHELHIALPTIRTHLSRLFAKFSVQDRVELIVSVLAQSRHAFEDNGSRM
jgi:DNA-binding NarL/FixJ family response regulator